MARRQSLVRLTRSISGVTFKTQNRNQLVAARFAVASSWLAHQSMQQCRSRSDDDSGSQHNDCPLCQQFGQGPCKETFYAWYNCTEEAAGSGRSEDEITEDCAKLFDAFRVCLDSQPSESTSNDETPLPDTNVGELPQLPDAWHQIIYSDLASARRDSFPLDKRPVITKSSEGSHVSFSQTDLVLVFIERLSQNGGIEIIAAAAAGDLIADTLRIPNDRLDGTIIVSAVYEMLTNDGESELVVCEERIESNDL
jgi:hypothetical protein